MDQIKNVIETLTSTTENITSFVQMVANWIRDKKWVELISLLLSVIIFVWLSREGITKFIGEEASQWFFIVCLIGGILFAIAVLIAVLQKPKLPTTVTPLGERTAIKGLRPFAQKDAEIFRQLERNNDIAQCLNLLNDKDFRIGILWGESGCGKSSFIQAGLIPELIKEESQQRGIYLKFSDKSATEIIKQGIIKELNLNHQETKELDLLGVLSKGVEVAGKPLILFFDQFEQVFVHRNQWQEDYQTFVDTLKQWYEDESLNLKILMSFRSDLFYFQHDIQQKLNYSLSSFNNYKLEKFSPDQATNVLEIIAKTENIEFDKEYIKQLAEEELVSKDNLISPVDLQILSLVINGQKTTKQRAFKKSSLQALGKIEGLLFEYIEDVITLREKSTPNAQRERLMKVLLEFIDSNSLTRSGAFTLNQLQENLKEISAEDVKEAIQWLELERLITPLQQQERETAYELAHERMIPAVMKLSNRILPKAYRANELLTKNVRIWLDSDCSSRYLLNLRELWLIETHRNYLIWDNQQRQKQTFIQRSKRKLYNNAGIIAGIAVLVASGWGWLNYTTSGQLWQIRRDLKHWALKTDDQSQSQAAIAFAKDGKIEQQLLEKIDDSYTKVKALSGIAQASSQLKDTAQAVSLLEEAVKSANQINDSYTKAQALSSIAQASSQLKDTAQAVSLLEKVFVSVDQIKINDDDSYTEREISYTKAKAEALSSIAQASSQLKDTAQAISLLEKVLVSVDQIDDLYDKAQVLSGIAQAFSQLKDTAQAVSLLEKALVSVDQIDDSYTKAQVLTSIAQASSQLNDTAQAVSLLQKALVSVDQINDPYDKAQVLTSIAQASSQLNDTAQAVSLLQKVLVSVDQIKINDDDSYTKAGALSSIAQASSQLKDTAQAVSLLEKVLVSVDQINDPYDKAQVLSGIAQDYSQLKDTAQAISLLEKVLVSVDQIDDSYTKAQVLTSIAEASSQLKDTAQAISLLEKVLVSVDQIDDSYTKAETLSSIAQAYS